MALRESNVPVTPGKGLKMKTSEEGGVHIPHQIISSVGSETELYTGKVTIPQNAATALAAESVEVKQVFVRAASDNSVEVYILADPLVLDAGYELSAGESIPIVIDDLSKIYLYCGSIGQVVTFIGSGT